MRSVLVALLLAVAVQAADPPACARGLLQHKAHCGTRKVCLATRRAPGVAS